MKALTVRQPWAGAIVHQTKRVENRTWKLPAKQHGARILIHAGTQLDKNAKIYGPHLGVYGAIVGIATLTGCHAADEDGTCCGPWGFPDVYHWQLDAVTALVAPVPCKGALGFWNPTVDVLAAVTEQSDPHKTTPGTIRLATEGTPARHTCHNRATASGPDWQCPHCSTLPSSLSGVAQQVTATEEPAR